MLIKYNLLSTADLPLSVKPQFFLYDNVEMFQERFVLGPAEISALAVYMTSVFPPAHFLSSQFPTCFLTGSNWE